MVKMSTVWDRTTEFLGTHAAAVMPIAVLAILLPTVLAGTLEAWRLTLDPFSQAAIGVGGLVLTIVTLWGTTAITALAIEPVGAAGAAAIANRRLLPVIGVTIALLLGLSLLLLPALGIVLVGGIDIAALASAQSGTMPDINPTAVLAAAAYVLVASLVLLWLAARLVIVTPVVVAERRGLGAITRAWQLSRGHALRIIGMILLYGLIAGIATLAAQAAFGTILGLTLGTPGTFGIDTVLTALLVGVVTVVISVVQSVFVAKLYSALAPQRSLAEEFA
ncbi:glycerophosphoryl diester phosphodiesterase membrane domain-containing protein [Sphingomonas sp. 37zxx]|uniref:glycerophosphoryl diester phosphodiesterase membrane domain-containing protein n=1 Tax=Sphingomonas sp. 37zxx TaxID=1550073 RepID=UPI00053BEC38|nr:glycerophosphoryl diester phosphodiesterase membrane domain-containing protein [Sphingomonas sp. 37zxx]